MNPPDSNSTSPTVADSQSASLYRPEALLAHQRGPSRRRNSPWLDPEARRGRADGWAFYGLLSLAVVALVIVAWMPLDQRATGDAVLRLKPGGDPSTASDYLIHASFAAEHQSLITAGKSLRFDPLHSLGPVLEARITTVAATPVEGDRRQPVSAHLEVRAEVRAEIHDGVRPETGLEGVAPTAVGPMVLRDGLQGRAGVYLGRTRLVRRIVPSLAIGGSGDRQ